MHPRAAFVINVLFTTSLISTRSIASRIISKRSDDGNPMAVVVDNLSKQLNLLSAKVDALETKQSAGGRVVAFTAWHSTQPLIATPHGILALDYALTNLGQSYNTLTGVFTVPVSGLYDFQASFMPYPTSQSKKVYAGIYVDSSMVAEGVADSQHGFWDQSTIRAVVHVKQGQQVTMRNVEADTRHYYSSRTQPYTAFSGYLVRADS